MRILFRAGALALGIIAGAALPAFAHAHLAAAIPAPDTSVAVSPGQLSLTFTEPVDAGFSRAVLRATDGSVVPTGNIQAAPGDGTQLLVPVSQMLSGGKYVVDWSVVAVVGHKSAGSFGFVVTP